MKSLLISSEESGVVTNIMKSTFPKVELVQCHDLSKAQDIIISEGAFLPVIIDADQSPFAQEVIDLILDNIGECPILLLGTNDGLDHAGLKSNLYVTRMSRPINPEKFKGYVRELLAQKEKQEEDSVEVVEKEIDNFVSLRLRSFYLYKSLPYDTYMQITDSRYMKVLPKDIPYHQGTIQRLKERNVKRLYLEKDNHISFIESTIEKLKHKIHTKKNHDLTSDISDCVEAVSLIQEYLLHIGVSDQIHEFVDFLVPFTSSIAERIDNVDNIYRLFSRDNLDIPEQAVFKLIYCLYMLRKLTWSSPTTKEKIMLAAIIHDIYLDDPGHALITDIKTHTELEQYEVDVINHHTVAAEKIATQFAQVSDFSYLVTLHHQIPDERAFPFRASSTHINQLTALFVIVNHLLSEYMLLGSDPLQVKPILKSMEATYELTAFKSIFTLLRKLH